MFPTKVFFIDDDRSSFKKLTLGLDNSKCTYQLYDRPHAALSYLNEEYKIDLFEKRLISQPIEEEWQHKRLDINIYDLMKEVYNPSRFEHVSTVIIDYEMPKMNGLEVCAQIKNPHIQKILLTGEGDETLAVQAFNKGLINRYIQKQDPNVFELLNESIAEAQRAYFLNISQLMLGATTFEPGISYIEDPAFISFFEKLLLKHKIVEYYLFEMNGSFLLLDEKSNCYGLFTYNKSQLDGWKESLEFDTVPKHLARELADYKKMICFHDRHQIDIPQGSEWEKYSYTPEVLEGQRDNYFYVFQKNLLDIERERVLSFHDYKNRSESDGKLKPKTLRVVHSR
jgi:CheY-like chemotaxis protein